MKSSLKNLSLFNLTNILVGGKLMLSNVPEKAHRLQIGFSEEATVRNRIIEKIRSQEALGYQYEKADASFVLLVKEILGQRKQLFEIVEFQIHCKTRIVAVAQKNKSDSVSQAVIRIRVNEEKEHVLSVGEGNGPISALDRAIHKALLRDYF